MFLVHLLYQELGEFHNIIKGICTIGECRQEKFDVFIKCGPVLISIT